MTPIHIYDFCLYFHTTMRVANVDLDVHLTFKPTIIAIAHVQNEVAYTCLYTCRVVDHCVTNLTLCDIYLQIHILQIYTVSENQC